MTEAEPLMKCDKCRYYGRTTERPPVHSMGGRYAHVCYRNCRPRVRIVSEEGEAPPACKNREAFVRFTEPL